MIVFYEICTAILFLTNFFISNSSPKQYDLIIISFAHFHFEDMDSIYAFLLIGNSCIF